MTDGRMTVKASVAEVFPCACVDLGDGRIEVTYPANTPVGLLEVWVGLEDADPLGLTAQDEPDAAERRVTRRLSDALGNSISEQRLGLLNLQHAIRFGDANLVIAPGVLRVKPGLLFDVLVFAVDDAGRQQPKGGEQLRAQLSTGPAPVALEVYDNHDGSYRVATAVQVSGEYKIAFYLNGLPVAGSPITLVAPRGPAPERSASPRLASPRPASPRPASPRHHHVAVAERKAAGSGSTARTSSPRRAMTREQHHQPSVRESPRAASPRAASPRVRSRPLASPHSAGTGKPPALTPPPPRLPTASALPAAHAATMGYTRILGESN